MLTSSQAHRTGTMIAAPLYPPFSRNFDDEQDYADEKNSSRASIFDSQALPPLLRWKRGIAQHHHSSLKDDHKLPLTVKTLIVGFQGGGASYAHTLFNLSNNGDDNDSTTSGNSTEENAAEWVGTLVLPGCGNPTGGPSGSALWGGGAGDSLEAADPHNLSCNIFRKKRGACSVPEGEDEGCGDVAIVSCGYCVPALAAHAWARVLLENISAEVVVVFTSVAVEPGRSEGWEGAKLLATSQAEERDDCLEMSRGFQPLPTPSMVTGPAAALVSHCQRQGRAAMCFAISEWPGRGGQDVSGAAFGCTAKALRVVAGDTLTPPAEEVCADATGELADHMQGNLYI